MNDLTRRLRRILAAEGMGANPERVAARRLVRDSDLGRPSDYEVRVPVSSMRRDWPEDGPADAGYRWPSYEEAVKLLNRRLKDKLDPYHTEIRKGSKGNKVVVTFLMEGDPGKALRRAQKKVENALAIMARDAVVSALRPKAETGMMDLADMRRMGSASKTAAGRPYLSEITRKKYRDGEAFMAYYIDAAKNHSKFYEMVVVPDDMGTYTLKKKWGALGQGRQDNRIHEGMTYDQAVREMNRHGKSKLRKGYIDAFSTQPVGQYPVGLEREVGFGWGTQAITQCVPALREMAVQIDKALAEVAQDDPADLLRVLESMAVLLGDIPDSMSKELSKRMRPPLQRMKRNPRFIDDPLRTKKELKTLQRYVDKQIATCNR